MYRRTTTMTLRTLRVVEEYHHDDEPPSLGGIPVYDTTGSEVTESRPLAKCEAAALRKKASGR